MRIRFGNKEYYTSKEGNEDREREEEEEEDEEKEEKEKEENNNNSKKALENYKVDEEKVRKVK